MARTPVVLALQKWEYLSVIRKSESALYNELVVVGEEGWELVSAHDYKDPKGVATWIAFLKRPGGDAPPGAASKGGVAGSKKMEGKPPVESPKGFDLDGDVFDIKKEEPAVKKAEPAVKKVEPAK
jgi:hypothetical protein